MHRLYKNLNKLTNKQRNVLNYIIENADLIKYISLKDLAIRIGVSEVTLLNVCRKIGYEGFSDLKKAMRNHTFPDLYSAKDIETMIHKKTNSSQEEKCKFFDMIFSLEKRNMMDMLNGLDVNQIFQCAKLLLESHEVIIFGHNASKSPADYLAHRLNYLRVNSRAIKLGDSDIVKTALARLGDNDVGVFFSFPPYYYPTAEVVKYAQMKGAKIITITDDMASPAVLTEEHVFICKTEIPFFYNALSMPMVFVELIVCCMAIQLGEQFGRIIKDELMINRFINGSQ